MQSVVAVVAFLACLPGIFASEVEPLFPTESKAFFEGITPFSWKEANQDPHYDFQKFVDLIRKRYRGLRAVPKEIFGDLLRCEERDSDKLKVFLPKLVSWTAMDLQDYLPMQDAVSVPAVLPIVQMVWKRYWKQGLLNAYVEGVANGKLVRNSGTEYYLAYYFSVDVADRIEKAKAKLQSRPSEKESKSILKQAVEAEQPTKQFEKEKVVKKEAAQLQPIQAETISTEDQKEQKDSSTVAVTPQTFSGPAIDHQFSSQAKDLPQKPAVAEPAPAIILEQRTDGAEVPTPKEEHHKPAVVKTLESPEPLKKSLAESADRTKTGNLGKKVATLGSQGTETPKPTSETKAATNPSIEGKSPTSLARDAVSQGPQPAAKGPVAMEGEPEFTEVKSSKRSEDAGERKWPVRYFVSGGFFLVSAVVIIVLIFKSSDDDDEKDFEETEKSVEQSV